MKNSTGDDKRSLMSDDAFKVLGGGKVAYVKPVRSEDVHRLYPEAPIIQPGLKLYALHTADGTPLMVTDSREAAVANAMTHDLETVSTH
jgi:hypothetical protein